MNVLIYKLRKNKRMLIMKKIFTKAIELIELIANKVDKHYSNECGEEPWAW